MGRSGLGEDPRDAAGVAGRPIVLFDGGCPMCRREIAHYQRLDRAGAVLWRDIVSDPRAPEAAGVSWDDAMRRLHVIDPVGAVHTGARAFVVVWQALPRYRWLAHAVVAVPGLVGLMDRAYVVFADWRWRRRCRDGVCGIR
jgi:predicted DCC family thiol-disulfide oxidoreductase YuxK